VKTYVAKPKTPKSIEFELAGDLYHFTGGKDSDMLLALMAAGPSGAWAGVDRTREMLNWLGHGLNPEHGEKDHKDDAKACEVCRLQGRLLDKNDDAVDLDIVLEIINDLQAEVSGRPTG
jgi:hypothetical protein